jgi:hypothetical protein
MFFCDNKVVVCAACAPRFTLCPLNSGEFQWVRTQSAHDLFGRGGVCSGDHRQAQVVPIGCRFGARANTRQRPSCANRTLMIGRSRPRATSTTGKSPPRGSAPPHRTHSAILSTCTSTTWRTQANRCGVPRRPCCGACKEDIGDRAVGDLTKQELVQFGRRRAKEGAGAATLAIDFSFIGTVMTNAAAVRIPRQ